MSVTECKVAEVGRAVMTRRAAEEAPTFLSTVRSSRTLAWPRLRDDERGCEQRVEIDRKRAVRITGVADETSRLEGAVPEHQCVCLRGRRWYRHMHGTHDALNRRSAASGDGLPWGRTSE